VSRARRTEERRGRTDLDEAGDDLDLDIYVRFNRNDLRVTVFANRVVSEKLFPTLLRMFV